ncbi:YceH family protein [Desulfatiferula olefinivorans]
METLLTDVEIRILGSLIEKKMATPEYYPLSLNALINACNQKSNREPVVAWDDETVLDGIKGLVLKKRVFESRLGRVSKYEECTLNESGFVPAESAILCVLMLRGPQTAGEIRTRTERLYAFDSLEHVSRIIDHLIERGQVIALPRRHGHKEIRFHHTLGAAWDETAAHADAPQETPQHPSQSDRITALEQTVETLAAELADLKQQFAEFRKQFE